MTRPNDSVLEYLRRAVLLGDGARLGDGELLGGFIERHDEDAFAALVRRHGPMVWGVCRRVLRNHHDAEDAFQATFLVLARKATSIRSRELVGNWLYGVAHQTALQARRAASRRKAREVLVTVMPDTEAVQQDQSPDMQPLLDEELSRLPDKYRAVIVLCELEGLTRKEVARHLGVPEGTVAGRLARARTMLAKRLARRGMALPVGVLGAAGLSQNAASAGVQTTTIKAAILFAAGQAATPGAISAEVAALTEGVLKAMLMAKLRTLSAVLSVVAMAGFGAGLICYGTGAVRQGSSEKSDATAPRKEGGKPTVQKDEEALQGTWYVLAMEEGGKPQPKGRFEDVKMRLVVKGDKLSIMTTTPDGRDVGQQDVAFTLDVKVSPRRIDASKDGRTIHGIYAFEKGQLKLCIDPEGVNRPTSFKTGEGTQQRSYILQKKDAAAK